MKTCYIHRQSRSIVDLIHPGEVYPGWTISRISVLPAHRGKGYARMLLDQVIAEADAEEVLLFLDVQPDISTTGLNFDQLWAFYSRLGFVASQFGYPGMVRIPPLMGSRVADALSHTMLETGPSVKAPSGRRKKSDG